MHVLSINQNNSEVQKCIMHTTSLDIYQGSHYFNTATQKKLESQLNQGYGTMREHRRLNKIHSR